MVALNDLIICPQISKTHFEARDSFPWRPGGVIPLERPLISDVLLGQKKKRGGWYQLKSTTDSTPRGMRFEVATYHRELVKQAHSLCS